MLVSGSKWKTRKIMIPSPVPLIFESLVSVKENTDKKEEKKKERKKKIRIEKKTN